MPQISRISISDSETDKILLKLISEKDTNSLSRLYDIHSKYLYTIIYYILKNEPEAEDVLQEVFLQIWEKIDSYDENLGSPLSWITKITRNKAIDRIRSKGFKKRTGEVNIDRFFDLSDVSSGADPESGANSIQESREILSALGELTENQRELIEYAYFRGFTQTELAEHFKIPLGTVKTRMRAAMMLLRTKLQHLI